MTAEVTFDLDGMIHMIVFRDLLRNIIGAVGLIPVMSREKLEIITVDMRDLENLITLLKNL